MTAAEIVVSRGAIARNVARIAALTGVPVMAVVKADGYGHGMVETARAARAGGAAWLGVATPAEALALRAAGDQGPVLTWLTVPSDDLAALVAAGIDVAAYSLDELHALAAVPGVARVHLKADTGLSRGGFTLAQWPEAVALAAALEAEGRLRVAGLWTHPISADEPRSPHNLRQLERFRAAVESARAAGLDPEVVHMASSGLAVTTPEAWFSLVRPGIAIYGINPGLPAELWDPLGLEPAMTVRGELALVKTIAAGESVSYGATWTAPADTRVGLVPFGYAEGIPRAVAATPGKPGAEVLVGGRRVPVRGRICMDQFVVDLGPESGSPVPASAGDEVVLFGPGGRGEPTADEWAAWAGTINYEIVTRIGGRARQRWVD